MFNINFKHVEHDQGSNEWLVWRAEGEGASEVVVIAGKCEFKTPNKLYLEKKGLIETEDLSRNPNIIRGNRCEPIVRDHLINHFGTSIEVFCGEDANHPHRKVSFDGVMLEVFQGKTNLIPVEIKAPCEAVFKDVAENLEKSENYQHHLWQIQYQIAMLDAPYGYLAFFCESTNNIKLFKVYADIEMQKTAFDLIDNFHYNYIEKGVEPPLDPNRDTFVLGDDIKNRWDSMASDLYRIKTREAELKKELDELKSESNKISKNLVELTKGFKKVRAGNVTVTRVKAKNSFDYASFVNDKDIMITADDLEKYSKERALSFRVTLYDKKELKERERNSQLEYLAAPSTLEGITKAVRLVL